MSRSGDDGVEMPGYDPFDDAAIEALLSGTARSVGTSGLASFVDDLRSAAAAVPAPSPALAAAIAAGGIATAPPVAKWRSARMKIQGFVAGLGVAGKLALGVGVAAAATTGAGAAGALPDPVQHVVARAIEAVSPFSFPDPEHHGGATAAPQEAPTSTTTQAGVTTTSDPEHHGKATPTTSRPSRQDGEHTPTSKGPGDADNPELLSISCERSADPVQIVCLWTASPNGDHAHYVVLRTGDGGNRVLVQTDGLSMTDNSVKPGVNYVYRVDSVRADGSVDSHSPAIHVECCGAPPVTTPSTSEHHGGGGTTTTVAEGDGTTTTTAGEHHH